MESGGDDFAMVSPFLSFEAEEAVTFKLLHKWVSLNLLIEFCLGGEDISDEVWIGDGETNRRSEPHQKCCTCKSYTHNSDY